MRRLLPTLGLATCLATWAAPAQATVLVEVPLDDMIVDADGIVLGQVVRVGVQMRVREDGTFEPWTATTIRVESWLKNGNGDGTVDEVTIYERGGVWQGGGMRIAGTPTYRVGERVVVFLWRDPLGRLRTYGMVQGRFLVRAGVDMPTTVERDLHDVGFAQWSNGTMRVTHLEDVPVTLDQLRDRIHTVLEMIR